MTTFGTTPGLRYRLSARWRALLSTADPAPASRGTAPTDGLHGEATERIELPAAGHHVYVSDAVLREPGQETAALGWTSADWLKPTTEPIEDKADRWLGQATQVINRHGLGQRLREAAAEDPPLFRETAGRLGQTTYLPPADGTTDEPEETS